MKTVILNMNDQVADKLMWFLGHFNKDEPMFWMNHFFPLKPIYSMN